MDAHERHAVERRLSKVGAEIKRIPKGIPRPELIARWRGLLNEREHLLEMLAEQVPGHELERAAK